MVLCTINFNYHLRFLTLLLLIYHAPLKIDIVYMK